MALRQRWSRQPVLVRDAVLAGLLSATTQLELVLARDDVEGSLLLQHAAFAVMTGSLVLRRAQPFLACLVGTLALGGQTLLGDAPVVGGYLALLVLTYSVATYGRSRREAVGGLLVLIASVEVYAFVAREPNVADEIANIGIVVAVWSLARVARTRLVRAVEAERAAQSAALERERALAAERRRIARELHDVVAHGITLMLLQTEVARAGGALPPAAADALEVADDAGRRSLDDLRRMLHVLRDAGDPGDLRGLRDLAGLVDDARRAGLRVELDVDVDGDLPASLDAAAYRVVQEALTNAARHAPGSDVRVTVRTGAHGLVVEVVDGGAVSPVPAQRAGAGLGLVGVRERVALHGGTVSAGPHERGWRVHAMFPAVPA
ncbi:MAG: sensor histidine kinase [Actinomycetes bacterium]